MAQVTANTGIRVNGADEPLDVATIAALIDAKVADISQQGVAVALNGRVVPRAEWPATKLSPGDCVEIVRARQGG